MQERFKEQMLQHTHRLATAITLPAYSDGPSLQLLVKHDAAHLLVNVNDWREFYVVVTNQIDACAFLRDAARSLETVAQRLSTCMEQKHLPPPRMGVPWQRHASRSLRVSIPHL